MKIKVLAATALLLGSLTALPAAADNWNYPVMVRQPALDWEGKLVSKEYHSFDPAHVTKKWNICFSGTAFKSPVWIAYAYGAVKEAQRLGVSLSLFEAGSYTNIDRQISHVENCVAQGADAILIFALSQQGVLSALNTAREQGVVIVDVGNGVSGSNVDGRVVAPYYQAGKALGEYLALRHPNSAESVNLLWLPGPAGVTWAESATEGLKDQLTRSGVNIVKTMYGETGKVDQMKLVENGLQAYPDLDYIAGIGEAIEGAAEALRRRGDSEIKLLSDYITPGVYEGVRRGTIQATVTDGSVMLLRIAVDMAVRILEGNAKMIDAAPAFLMVDQDNVQKFDPESSLAPKEWEPIFKVN